MPLPSDEQLISTANEVLGLFQGAFGPHPGFRPAHAKGQILSGKFTPTPSAKRLSTAPHFQGGAVPVTVRFSNSTGIPQIPDTSEDSKPHGIAVRFELGTKDDGKRWHTDIIGHSTPHFPVRTGAEFGELLKAIGASSGENVPSPKPIEQFLGSHPAALRFVTAPKPFPSSFATEAYFMLNAFFFVDVDGKKTKVRYRVVPTLGKEPLDDEAVKSKGENYLFDEVAERVKRESLSFKLVAQIGKDEDPTDDITQEWPDDRELVDLGHIELDKLVEDSLEKQRYAIFDPIPRVDGIEPSSDPILEFRAALYLISGKKRRENKA